MTLSLSNPKSFGSGLNVYSLKGFSIELQNNLVSKMSSPIDSVKKEAAEYAISFWENIPKISNETELVPSNGWN
jgi:hypothetical protein